MTTKTIIVIPHHGPDALIYDLFRSIGLVLREGCLGADLTLIEQPAYSFLIVNNNTTNRGFTAACNVGLAKLRESPDDFAHAWLLNNDTAFESLDQFHRALSVMQSVSTARNWAMIAQQVRHFARPDEIIFGGSLECFPVGRHKAGLRSRGDWFLPSEEQWLSFCSVLIRRDVVGRIGFMDETLANYYSDSDYSLRAREAGYKIGYAGQESYVFHKAGQSSHPSLDQQRVLRQDYLNFWRKWISGARHALYLSLMTKPVGEPAVMGAGRGFAAGELCRRASAYRELRAWLDTLPPEQELGFKDIVQHFQHQAPISGFSILCNIARELDEPG